MLVILVPFVVIFAIYEIVARVRDCRWISPDFTARGGPISGTLQTDIPRTIWSSYATEPSLG